MHQGLRFARSVSVRYDGVDALSLVALSLHIECDSISCIVEENCLHVYA